MSTEMMEKRRISMIDDLRYISMTAREISDFISEIDLDSELTNFEILLDVVADLRYRASQADWRMAVMKGELTEVLHEPFV